MVVNLWRYRRLILRNAVNDLRTRYSGSVAGYLWNIFIPLAQIVVFSLVFSALMGWRADLYGMTGRFSFVVFLCSGLLPWNAFGETVMRGVSSLVGNAGYLKNLRIPEQIFVAQDACSGFLSALVALALFMVFAAAVAGHGPYWGWLQFLPAMLLFSGFAFGVGLFFSCLNVFFRDVGPLMNVVLLLWFWLTPIVYPESLFADKHVWMLEVLRWNPAYHYVHAFHEAMVGHLVGPRVWGVCLGITLVANAAAYGLLRKLRAEIRDVL
jgi:lipopolysaccharide transport system permease protein